MKEFKNQISILEFPELLPEEVPAAKTTACFTGHRNLSRVTTAAVKLALTKQIEILYHSGIRTFYCGGAVGFDMLAGFSVLDFQMRLCHKDVTLILALPALEQDKYYSKAEKEMYRILKLSADRTELINGNNARESYLQRDRYMVDNSGVCVAYCTQTKGGTAYTVRYAQRTGKPVINLADEVEKYIKNNSLI